MKITIELADDFATRAKDLFALSMAAAAMAAARDQEEDKQRRELFDHAADALLSGVNAAIFSALEKGKASGGKRG